MASKPIFESQALVKRSFKNHIKANLESMNDNTVLILNKMQVLIMKSMIKHQREA